MSVNSKKLALAALAGVLATGFTAPAFAQDKNDAAPAGKTAGSNTVVDKHSCKGMNECKGHGSDGKNECKGKGACATDGSKK